MNKGKRVLGRLAMAALACCAAAGVQAATVDLTHAGYVTYGDGNSYSLPLAGITVMAGPGQISAFTKLGLQSQLNNNTAGMDDAFDTPSANNTDGFRMSAANEAGGGVGGNWDRNGWWDATVASLSGALDLTKNSLVFFFANNETGANGQIANDSSANLAAWARIELTQISTGNLLGRFDLTNNASHNPNVGYGPPPVGGGVVSGDVTQYTSTGAAPTVSDFLMSGGEVCLSGTTLVDCNNPALPITNRVQHNLGGDRAAYAVVFPELDAKVATLVATSGVDLNDYALHVEFRLGCGAEGSFPTTKQGNKTLCDDRYALNGGSEKVFLGTQALTTTTQVPEPGALALVGLALAAAGVLSRRRLAA